MMIGAGIAAKIFEELPTLNDNLLSFEQGSSPIKNVTVNVVSLHVRLTQLRIVTE